MRTLSYLFRVLKENYLDIRTTISAYGLIVNLSVSYEPTYVVDGICSDAHISPHFISRGGQETQGNRHET